MASPKTVGGSAPFIVSFGAESFFLDRDLEKARNWADRSVVFVDGDGATDVEIVGICESRPMDDVLRVVIVDEANKVKGDKALRTYIEEKSPKDDSTILVAILRSEKCSELWQLAARKSKNGKPFEHKKLKTYSNDNEVVKWVEGEAKRIGLTLDGPVPEALFALVGSDLYRISSELRKLSILAGKEMATMQHLKLVIAKAPMAEPYQVADAATDRDPKRAMNLLSTVYKNMGDEANVPVAYALMRQVEKLIVVRSMLDRGVSEGDIATAIGMHPWRFKNSLLPQALKHSLSGLIRVMGRLCKLDLDVKGSARSKRTHVELAVLSVTG